MTWIGVLEKGAEIRDKVMLYSQKPFQSVNAGRRNEFMVERYTRTERTWGLDQ